MRQGCYAAGGLLFAAFLADTLVDRWDGRDLLTAGLGLALIMLFGFLADILESYTRPEGTRDD